MTKKVVRINSAIGITFIILFAFAMIWIQSLQLGMIRYGTDSVSKVELEEGQYSVIMNINMVLGPLDQKLTDTSLETEFYLEDNFFYLSIFESSDPTNIVEITPMASNETKAFNGYIIGEFTITDEDNYIIEGTKSFDNETGYSYYIGTSNITLHNTLVFFTETIFFWYALVMITTNIIIKLRSNNKKTLNQVKSKITMERKISNLKD